MNSTDLNDLLIAEPFQPFRLTLTTAETVDITDPGCVFIHGLSMKLFTVERKGSRIADRFRIIGLRHIVHVDMLETAEH